MKLDGAFTYKIDGEGVKTVEEFYEKTNNKNYIFTIDGLNIVATSKSEPFFLDEIIVHSFSPKTDNKEKIEDFIKGKIDEIFIPDIAYIFKLPEWKSTNSFDTASSTSVFEKVQDSTMSNQTSLDAYNAITGHSTRHKASASQTDLLNCDGNKITYWGGLNENPMINKPSKESESIQSKDFPGGFGWHNYDKRGKVVTYSKSGKKETENKVDYSEIDWDFIEQLAKRMSKNKDKYVVNNWKAPTDTDKLKQALLRHVLEVIKGNYADGEDKLGHLEAIALNAQFLNYQIKNIK